MNADITFIGKVRRVVGAKVVVEISPDIPSASPIINGRVHKLGQVGSFVRLPQGFLNLFGIVSMVGASEAPNVESVEGQEFRGQRWIEVQLVGESYGATGFERGVSVFPTLDDEVHVVTEDDLAVIYRSTGPSILTIGTLAASESLPATLNIDKLVTRHAAIVGSTGSGKSNTVAGLLKAIGDGGFPSAQIVVIDPHGEYASALKGLARVYSIGSETDPLIVPYWALSFDELAWFLVDRRTGTETAQDLTLRDYLFEQKRATVGALKSGAVTENAITADSPVPFPLRDLWYHFDRKERATYTDQARSIEALIGEGDAKALRSARFHPHSTTNSAPFKPQVSSMMGGYVTKILARLKDQRFDFLLNPGEYDGEQKDLDDLLKDWLNHQHSITVFDLAGIPFEVVDVVVGAISRILFESMFWGRDLRGIGRQRPLLLVFEEAHGYLPKGGSGPFIPGYATRAARRIFKEGRKYGVGALIVSQRPSDLDETLLSQCGTFIALRLSNGDDQGRIRSMVPDSLAGLIDMLPALRTGEALMLGEAVQIPSRVRLPLIEPRPKSDDPEPAQNWKEAREGSPQYDKAITGWRTQRTQT